MRLHVRRHPAPGVAHDNLRVPSGCGLRVFTTEFGVVDDVSSLDRQAAAVRHRIARIQRQIHEHLLDLAGIRFHASKRRRQHHRDLDLLTDQPAQHLTRLLHHGIAVQQARFDHRFPAEQQQLTGQQ